MTEEKLKLAHDISIKLNKLNIELRMLNNKETDIYIGKWHNHNSPTRFKELREHTNKSIEALVRADLQSRISLLTEQLAAL